MNELDLKTEIAEAEMILTGLGEEFDEPYKALKKMPADQIEFINLVRAVLRQEGLEWAEPLLLERISNGNEEMVMGLNRLAEILRGKNYFVITLSQNGIMEEIPWREGRLVMPCGSTFKKQCAECCEGTIPKTLTEIERKELKEEADRFWENAREDHDSNSKENAENQLMAGLPADVARAMQEIGKRERIKKAVGNFRESAKKILGSCECCDGEMTLNVINTQKYDQRGYLDQWNKYVKWLGGTTNRKLLLLEIGTGEDKYGLIRKPFEKIAELNLKSKHVMIGENLQKQNHEKAIQITQNVIDWLEKLC